MLVVFLVLGMLAGEPGPGGIRFENVATAQLLGTTALAIILFDGELHTPWSSFRTGLGPGLSLATVGVLATAAVTAGCVVLLYGIPWLCQIGLFLMLGLLVTPSDLLPAISKALVVSGAIILLGRPLAVSLCLLPFRFPGRQVVFIDRRLHHKASAGDLVELGNVMLVVRDGSGPDRQGRR